MVSGTTPMTRELLKALLAVESDGVIVTFALGAEVPAAVERVTYGVNVFGAGGIGGRVFAVTFGPGEISAHIWDVPDAAQTDFDASCVVATDSRIIVRFENASLGHLTVSGCSAFSAMNGRDVCTDVPVVLLA